MIARPVPAGATVIAKPIVHGHSNPLPLQIPQQIIPDELKKSNAPKAMVWTPNHPNGQLVPLRQPEPAVFFSNPPLSQ